MSRFQKATRKKLKLRLALCGPAGSGKTLTALKVAAYLGQRIAVIDTENRSASKYVGAKDVPEFDVLELESFSPKTYVEAIHDAEREGYDVIVIDGISQAWSGKDGALEQVDKAAKRSQSGNTFMAWRDVTPMHNQFVDAMVHCKAHLIITMRVKTEWVLEENERGKKVPRKVGMAVEQRAGLEYETDVVGDLDIDHNLLISKTRCAALDGALINRPGRELAEKLLAWLDEGEPAQTSREAQTGLREGVVQTSGGRQLDEYGLEVPSTPCPVVRPGKANAGKRWDELPGPLVERMYADFGDKMSDSDRTWAEYILTKRQARKARESAAVEMAAEAGFVPDEAAQATAGSEAAS